MSNERERILFYKYVNACSLALKTGYFMTASVNKLGKQILIASHSIHCTMVFINWIRIAASAPSCNSDCSTYPLLLSGNVEMAMIEIMLLIFFFSFTSLFFTVFLCRLFFFYLTTGKSAMFCCNYHI